MTGCSCLFLLCPTGAYVHGVPIQGMCFWSIVWQKIGPGEGAQENLSYGKNQWQGNSGPCRLWWCPDIHLRTSGSRVATYNRRNLYPLHPQVCQTLSKHHSATECCGIQEPLKVPQDLPFLVIWGWDWLCFPELLLKLPTSCWSFLCKLPLRMLACGITWGPFFLDIFLLILEQEILAGEGYKKKGTTRSE